MAGLFCGRFRFGPPGFRQPSGAPKRLWAQLVGDDPAGYARQFLVIACGLAIGDEAEPAVRLDQIPFHPLAGVVKDGQVVLRFRETLFGGPAIPGEGLRVVGSYAAAHLKDGAEIVLRRRHSLLCREVVPGEGFTRVRLRAEAQFIEKAQIELGERVPLLGRALELEDCAGVVALLEGGDAGLEIG